MNTDVSDAKGTAVRTESRIAFMVYHPESRGLGWRIIKFLLDIEKERVYIVLGNCGFVKVR